MIPENITRDHVIQAIAQGLVEPWGEEENSQRTSTDYILRYEGKAYSPKYVISKANILSNGEELSSEEFQGGFGGSERWKANTFLENLEFEITRIDEGDDVVVESEENISESSSEQSKKDDESTNDKYARLVEEGRVEFITFHPSYAYEEFIEGITINPNINDDAQGLDYMIKDGLFKRFCARALACAINDPNWKEYGKGLENSNAVKGKYTWDKAYQNFKKDPTAKEKLRLASEKKEKRFLLIVDEINRGDIAKIFGELITLLEKDKRLTSKEEKIAILTYSNQEFSVPPNVYVVGTMNTADRSIALLDTALRRRFKFAPLWPDIMALRKKFGVEEGDASWMGKSIDKLKQINDMIRTETSLGRDKEIGHSYFIQMDSKDDETAIIGVWRDEIFPLLEEYCWNSPDLLTKIVGTGMFSETEMAINRDPSIIKAWLG